MGDKTKISWAEATWNPTTGCDKVSQGCKICYAEIMAARLQAMGQPNYANGFALTLQPHMLEKPLQWTKPRRIFVNSMSDLFHKNVPVEFIQQVFDVMHRAPQHQYLILTKRSERLLELDAQLKWAPHIWMGVSVEDMKVIERVDHLRQTHAHIKFLSCEPLLAPLTLNLDKIDWVIVGGESGTGARKMEIQWARDILKQCRDQQTAFFMKQLGGEHNKQATIDWFPPDLRVQEYPKEA